MDSFAVGVGEMMVHSLDLIPRGLLPCRDETSLLVGEGDDIPQVTHQGSQEYYGEDLEPGRVWRTPLMKQYRGMWRAVTPFNVSHTPRFDWGRHA
jgi:hypothetical protein